MIVAYQKRYFGAARIAKSCSVPDTRENNSWDKLVGCQLAVTILGGNIGPDLSGTLGTGMRSGPCSLVARERPRFLHVCWVARTIRRYKFLLQLRRTKACCAVFLFFGVGSVPEGPAPSPKPRCG